jgi:hypothetical protein
MRKERKRERIRRREWPRGFEADWDMRAHAATRKQAHQSATCRGCKAHLSASVTVHRSRQ